MITLVFSLLGLGGEHIQNFFFSAYEETPANLRDKFDFRVVRGMREVLMRCFDYFYCTSLVLTLVFGTLGCTNLGRA